MTAPTPPAKPAECGAALQFDVNRAETTVSIACINPPHGPDQVHSARGAARDGVVFILQWMGSR